MRFSHKLLTGVKDTGNKLLPVFVVVIGIKKKLLPVSLTPAMKPGTGFLKIPTGDKFIAGYNDAGDDTSPVTTTQENSSRRLQRHRR
jgi:hypothetical protein